MGDLQIAQTFVTFTTQECVPSTQIILPVFSEFLGTDFRFTDNLEVVMKKKQQQAISFLLAATLSSSLIASSTQTAQAVGASNDGSGKTVTDIPKPADPKGDVFKGEEWYDQRGTFEVNREDAHTSAIRNFLRKTMM